MADITLEAKPLLGGFDKDFGGVHLKEATRLAIVSLAIPQGDDEACAKALKKAFRVAMPDNGRYTTSKEGVRVLRTQPDQLFVMMDRDTPDARNHVHGETGSAFWTTEQTDNWCALELSGDMTRSVLERLCPIDLHPDVFGEDHLARTTMEHMGAMILRTGDDSFLLMSARSSSASFLHAIETSIAYVL